MFKSTSSHYCIFWDRLCIASWERMLHAARCVSQTRGRKGLRKGPDSWFLEYHLSLPRKFGALNVTNSFDLQTLRHNYSLVQIFAEQCSSRGLGGDSPLPEGPKTRGVRIGHPCYNLSTAAKVPKTETWTAGSFGNCAKLGRLWGNNCCVNGTRWVTSE